MALLNRVPISFLISEPTPPRLWFQVSILGIRRKVFGHFQNRPVIPWKLRSTIVCLSSQWMVRWWGKERRCKKTRHQFFQHSRLRPSIDLECSTPSFLCCSFDSHDIICISSKNLDAFFLLQNWWFQLIWRTREFCTTPKLVSGHGLDMDKGNDFYISTQYVVNQTTRLAVINMKPLSERPEETPSSLIPPQDGEGMKDLMELDLSVPWRNLWGFASKKYSSKNFARFCSQIERCTSQSKQKTPNRTLQTFKNDQMYCWIWREAKTKYQTQKRSSIRSFQKATLLILLLSHGHSMSCFLQPAQLASSQYEAAWLSIAINNKPVFSPWQPRLPWWRDLETIFLSSWVTCCSSQPTSAALLLVQEQTGPFCQKDFGNKLFELAFLLMSWISRH